jgi:hypothetical protein
VQLEARRLVTKGLRLLLNFFNGSADERSTEIDSPGNYRLLLADTRNQIDSLKSSKN